MNNVPDNIKFSNHSIKRFKERFPDAVGDDGSVQKAIARRVYKAKIDKRLFNNTNYMTSLYERYGTDHRYEFRIYEDILFVIRGIVLVTVYGVIGSHFDNDTSGYRKC